MKYPMSTVIRRTNAISCIANRAAVPQMMAYHSYDGCSNQLFQPPSTSSNSSRIRTISSSRATSQQQSSQEDSSSTASTATNLTSGGGAPSLRKVISPFLIMCHPDKVPSLYEEAKQVNLNAVQTLNSFIDSIQQLYNALAVLTGTSIKNTTTSSPLPNTTTTLLQLVEQQEIEFMVPSSKVNKKNQFTSVNIAALHNADHLDPNSTTDNIIYTRRSVTLCIPSKLLQEVQAAISSNTNNEQQQKQLMKHALREISKLLKAAEIPIPTNISSFLKNSNQEEEEEEEGRNRTIYIDWEEEKKRYQNAVKDMEADIATLNMSNPSRQLQIVTDIVSKVRFYPSTINPLDQLITLRRLSLLLLDNFHTLYIEDYGYLWENLIIIVVADDSTRTLDSSSSLQVPTRRRKKQMRESGFKFSLRGERQIVVKIPLNFIENQLVHEFTTHLPHFDMDDEMMM